MKEEFVYKKFKNDHAFARWLRRHGWEGATKKDHGAKTTRFVTPLGIILAVVQFDDTNCTYKVQVPS